MKMCQAFRANGHEITLFCRRGPEEVPNLYQYYGVEKEFSIVSNVRLPVRMLGPLLFARKLQRQVGQMQRSDLLYGRFVYGLFFMRHLGVPIIFESHAPPKNRFQHLIEEKLMQSENFIGLVVISESLKKIYLDTFPGLDEGRVMVAHDGADIPENALPSPPAPNGGTLQVGYIGHLYPGRGIDLIIEIAERVSDALFHIVGGNESDIIYWKNRSQNRSNILFHGHVPHGMLHQYYSFCDIMLAPYQRQVKVAGAGKDTSKWMSPLKLFEYMANGKAIIASDLPSIREILSDNINALLVPADRPDAWETAIRSLGDAQKRKALGENGKTLISEKFSWNQRAKHIVESCTHVSA